MFCRKEPELEEDEEDTTTDWFIRQLENRLKSGRNFVAVIHGQTRTGKSWLGGKICEQLDSNFSANHVYWFMDEVYEPLLTGELIEGSFAMIDEVGASLDNRRFMSSINVHASHVLETFGMKKVSLILTVPSLKMVDPNVRRLMHCLIFQRDRGMARIYRIDMGYDGTTYAFRIGKFEGVQKPSDAFCVAYEKKKREAFDEVLRKAIEETLRAKGNVQEVADQVKERLERDEWTPEEQHNMEDMLRSVRDVTQ